MSENHAELASGADGVLAAIRAKYPDEEAFHRNLEPFEDALRSRRRDALVEYLLRAPDPDWSERFQTAGDLYHHFLTDVMVEGCARTSKVVAATSSLQLYVHRVMMNLEATDGPPAVVARFADPRRQEEMTWRKNFQVWVANRKVFLHPELYLEPGLRDDKTPLFNALEDTLLQQEINDANVDDAYARYVVGFDEVAHLKIAGVCYDAAADTLHLFGAAHQDPPLFHHRRIDAASSAAPVASAWQPLTLQIPARKVAPVLFKDRLYVFWLEIATRPVSGFVKGDSVFQGYRHTVRVKYSMLRADNTWIPPQSLTFSEGGKSEPTRVIFDPVLSDPTRKKALADLIKDLNARRGTLVPSALESTTAERDRKAEQQRMAELEVEFRDPHTGKPREPSQSEIAEEVVVHLAAEAAKAWAIAGAVFAGPAAVLAGAAAWQAVIVAAAGTSFAELQAAGAVGDRYLTVRHKVALSRAKFLAWVTQQALDAVERAIADLDKQIAAATYESDHTITTVRWDRSGRDHTEPLDNYQPEGWEWERVYPDVHFVPGKPGQETLRLVLVPRNDPVGPRKNWSDEVDLLSGTLRPVADDTQSTEQGPRLNHANGQLTTIGTTTQQFIGQEYYLSSLFLNTSAAMPGQRAGNTPLTAAAQAVSGDRASIVVQFDGDPIWVRMGADGSCSGMRLGTTLTPELTAAFGQAGVNGLLSQALQQRLSEAASQISPVANQDNPAAQNPFSPSSPYLTYFRETFFQIPFLIADHLNSQQRFAESQRWYHHVFDPTAADGVAWRYRELRELNPAADELRKTLTDPLALAAYRADPFNPHAIARLRPGAYQKTIIMKYIDNLLDWGDSLFGRFTMESVNEATMLYVMAADILGPRPEDLGPCGEPATAKTYASIAPLLRPSNPGDSSTTDFLIEEVETATQILANPSTEGEYLVMAGTAMKNRSRQRVTKNVSMLARPRMAMSVAADSVSVAPTASVGGGTPAFGGPAPTAATGGTTMQIWKATGGTALGNLYSGQPIGGGVVEVLGGQSMPVRATGDPVKPPEQVTPLGGARDPLNDRKSGGSTLLPKGFGWRTSRSRSSTANETSPCRRSGRPRSASHRHSSRTSCPGPGWCSASRRTRISGTTGIASRTA